MKIEYDFFKNRLIVGTTDEKRYEYIRQGISETKVKEFLKEFGKIKGITILVEKGNLMPIYKGKIDLK